jgi:hypothetical protein
MVQHGTEPKQLVEADGVPILGFLLEKVDAQHQSFSTFFYIVD